MVILSIDTPRLVLRPWTRNDVDALHRIWTNAEVRRYLWDNVVISRELAEATVADCVARAENSGLGMWCVNKRDEQSIAGFCGFRPMAESKYKGQSISADQEHAF